MKTQTTIRVEEENYFQAKDILKKLGLNVFTSYFSF